MKPMTGNRRVVLMALLGASVGYLFLHPYTMVVYELHGAHGEEGGLRGALRLFSNIASGEYSLDGWRLFGKMNR